MLHQERNHEQLARRERHGWEKSGNDEERRAPRAKLLVTRARKAESSTIRTSSDALVVPNSDALVTSSGDRVCQWVYFDDGSRLSTPGDGRQ